MVWNQCSGLLVSSSFTLALCYVLIGEMELPSREKQTCRLDEARYLLVFILNFFGATRW